MFLGNSLFCVSRLIKFKYSFINDCHVIYFFFFKVVKYSRLAMLIWLVHVSFKIMRSLFAGDLSVIMKCAPCGARELISRDTTNPSRLETANNNSTADCQRLNNNRGPSPCFSHEFNSLNNNA